MAGNSGAANNTGVSPAIHVTITLVCFLLLVISFQQVLRTAVHKTLLLRNRCLVSINIFVLFLVCVSLNLDLSDITPDAFALCIRTLMIIWLFISFGISYPFLLNAIAAAYRSQRGQNQFRAPIWAQKIWFATIVVFEIIVVLLYIVAFSSMHEWPLKLAFISAYIVAIVAGSIAFITLIDVRCSIFKGTAIKLDTITPTRDRRHSNSNSNDLRAEEVRRKQTDTIARLRRGKRMINFILVLIVFLIIGAAYNIFKYFAFSNIYKGDLTSTVIDNNEDYLFYCLVNISYELTLIAWTYTSKTRCWPFCYCREALYDIHTVCFYCFAPCLLSPDTTAALFQHQQAGAGGTEGVRVGKDGIVTVPLNLVVKGAPANDTAPDTAVVSNRRGTGTTVVTHVSGLTATMSAYAFPPIDTKALTERRLSTNTLLKVILYSFDGVLTTQRHPVFEHWKTQHLQSLTQEQLLSFFGGREAVDKIRDHFYVVSTHAKLFLLTPDRASKIKRILSRIGLLEYFSNAQKTPTADASELEQLMANPIISCDHKTMKENNQSRQVFILNLIRMGRYSNDEILYVDHSKNITDHFEKINLCRTHLLTKAGLRANDFQDIETRVE